MGLTKKQELERARNQNRRLMKMIGEERQKVAGYEQVAQVNSAYIAILLKKLGATEDKPIDVPATEITEALSKYESRAVATEGGFGLYYVQVE